MGGESFKKYLLLVSYCYVTPPWKPYWCKTNKHYILLMHLLTSLGGSASGLRVEFGLLHIWGLGLGSVAPQGRVFSFQKLEALRGGHENKRCLLRSRLETGTMSLPLVTHIPMVTSNSVTKTNISNTRKNASFLMVANYWSLNEKGFLKLFFEMHY